MEDNRQYYARRAAEELQAAERAKSPEAQERHQTLAYHYSVIVEEQDDGPSGDQLEYGEKR